MTPSAGLDARDGLGPRERLLSEVIQQLVGDGIGNQSLRQIAAATGTSHRMLIYHFGSRDGLLDAIVERTERDEVTILSAMTSDPAVPLIDQGLAFWSHVIDAVSERGTLYFELAARAMNNDDTQSGLRIPNVDRWVAALTELWQRAGYDEPEAQCWARINLAVARGLLHDYLLTRDRKAVETAMETFARTTMVPQSRRG